MTWKLRSIHQGGDMGIIMGSNTWGYYYGIKQTYKINNVSCLLESPENVPIYTSLKIKLKYSEVTWTSKTYINGLLNRTMKKILK